MRAILDNDGRYLCGEAGHTVWFKQAEDRARRWRRDDLPDYVTSHNDVQLERVDECDIYGIEHVIYVDPHGTVEAVAVRL